MKSSLLASLFDEEERRPLTVSELNEQVRAALERRFSSVWLEGEISNFAEANSGHWYFTLKDQFSQMAAACFRGSNYKIRFKPFDGLQVRVWGKLSVYEPRGEYQIIVEALDPVGEGALKVAFEQLKIKLAREGLFDERLKRPLPFFPRKVGVVTSPNGAAIHDILNVLSRRTRTVHVVLLPVRVQGEGAGEEISKAIELANDYNWQSDEKIDVLIVGRGGGSTEDLWAFNDERLARAIRNSDIPIISAIGHETDFTIADFVADYRAPTPSAAAEIVAAQESQIEQFLLETNTDLLRAMQYGLLSAKSKLQELKNAPVFTEFPAQIQFWRQQVEANSHKLETLAARKFQEKQKRFDRIKQGLVPVSLQAKTIAAKSRLKILEQKHNEAIRAKFDELGEKFSVAVASLEALSPLAVLSRGYSLTQKADGAIVRNAEQVRTGENVQIRLANGKLRCEVIETENQ
jgi:exodeoxyribonuclease VII large subunit